MTVMAMVVSDIYDDNDDDGCGTDSDGRDGNSDNANGDTDDVDRVAVMKMIILTILFMIPFAIVIISLVMSKTKRIVPGTTTSMVTMKTSV